VGGGVAAGRRDLSEGNGSPPFDGSVPGLIDQLASPGSATYWSKYDWANRSRQASTTLAGLKEQPRYVIEALAILPAAGENQKVRSTAGAGSFLRGDLTEYGTAVAIR